MEEDAAMVNVGNTFGSAYIGAMIMMVFYGITCLQTYMFFFRYPKDNIPTKLLVSVLWIMDTVHVGLVSHAMYHYLVTNYANQDALDDGVWSLFVSIGVNIAIAAIVQTFFAHKIHGLNGRNWWLTGLISVTIIAHFGFGMETVAEFFIKKKLSRLSESTYIAALPFAVMAVASDIIITIALCCLLQNKKTTFQSTNILLNYLIIYTINRCLLTSAMAVVEVIVFAALPGTFWFLAFDFVIGKCYANSLLATLNSRQALRGKGLEATMSRPELSTMEGFTHTLDIADVTPSMFTRSRMPTQAERVSLSFDDTSQTAESKSMEMKDMRTPTDDPQRRLSIMSNSEACSSFNSYQRDCHEL